MRIPGTEGACFFSVGVEPEGVPQGVIPLKGGPARFVQFLKHQIELHEREKPSLEQRELTTEPAWCIEQEGFDPAREHEMESIFTVGNGYLGVRGALDTPIPGSQPDLFIAGIYDKKQVNLPYSELEFLTQSRGDYPYSEIVSFPFPFRIRLSIDEQPLDLMNGPWQDHRRILDLKKGMLFEQYAFEDDQGRRTLIKTLRCASMVDLHLLLQEIEVTCENYSGIVDLNTSIHELNLAHHIRTSRKLNMISLILL